MGAIFVFPIKATKGDQTFKHGDWVNGRWEVYEGITNAVKVIKDELPPGFLFILSEKFRQHSLQKDSTKIKGFSAFELVLPPPNLEWLPSIMVMHLESDGIYSATDLDDIGRLRKAGREILANLGVSVELIPETARAVVFTNDWKLEGSHGVYSFRENVDIFRLRSWVTESAIIASFQEIASTSLTECFEKEKISLAARRKFVNRFDSVLIHIWAEHIFSKDVPLNVFNILRSRNGITSRYAQLEKLADGFRDEMRYLEQRATNFLLVVLAIATLVVPLLSQK